MEFMKLSSTEFITFDEALDVLESAGNKRKHIQYIFKHEDMLNENNLREKQGAEQSPKLTVGAHQPPGSWEYTEVLFPKNLAEWAYHYGLKLTPELAGMLPDYEPPGPEATGYEQPAYVPRLIETLRQLDTRSREPILSGAPVQKPVREREQAGSAHR